MPNILTFSYWDSVSYNVFEIVNRSHARSSSLDLNRYPVLRQQQNPPPAIPPRFGGLTDQPSAATPSKSAARSTTNPMASVPGSSGYGGRDARSLQVVLGCGVDGVADDSLADKLCPS